MVEFVKKPFFRCVSLVTVGKTDPPSYKIR